MPAIPTAKGNPSSPLSPRPLEGSDLGGSPTKPQSPAFGSLVMATLGAVARQSWGIGTQQERRAIHVAEADQVLSPFLMNCWVSGSRLVLTYKALAH